METTILQTGEQVLAIAGIIVLWAFMIYKNYKLIKK